MADPGRKTVALWSLTGLAYRRVTSSALLGVQRRRDHPGITWALTGPSTDAVTCAHPAWRSTPPTNGA